MDCDIDDMLQSVSLVLSKDMSLKIGLLFILCILPLTAFSFSTVEPDSLVMDLKEIVVEGTTQKVVEDGMEYIPGKKVKASSYDILSLLGNMQIPQVVVSKSNNSIKTLLGDSYVLFINYVKADEADFYSLNPSDVLNVELMINPKDPRFLGERNVINLIVKKFNIGGFTKILSGGSLIGEESIFGKVYEKLYLDRWTIDISGVLDKKWSHHDFSGGIEDFGDVCFSGIEYKNIERISDIQGGRKSDENNNLNIRALWNVDTKLVSHSFSFGNEIGSLCNSVASINYTDNPVLPSKAVTDSRDKSINLGYNGNYQFGFDNNQFLMIEWSLNCSRIKGNSIYSPDNFTPIENDYNEYSYTPVMMLYYSRPLNGASSVSARLLSHNSIYNSTYSGSYNASQELNSSENIFLAEYNSDLSDKFGINLSAGMAYSYFRLNGKTVRSKMTPRFEVNLRFRPNSKNLLTVRGWEDNSFPSPYSINSAIIRSDELMWYEGNPNLRTSRRMACGLEYAFIPNNWLSFAAYALYLNRIHVPIYIYDSFASHDGLIRRFSDNSRQQEMSMGVFGTLKSFGNSLLMSAGAEYNRQLLTGILPRTVDYPKVRIEVGYYFRMFSIHGYYETPSKNLVDSYGLVSRYPSKYGIGMTLGIKNFKASLFFRNWFGDGRVRTEYASPAYSSSGWNWDSGFNRNISLNLSYLFDYGRKVRNIDEEIENRAVKNSSILK